MESNPDADNVRAIIMLSHPTEGGGQAVFGYPDDDVLTMMRDVLSHLEAMKVALLENGDAGTLQ